MHGKSPLVPKLFQLLFVWDVSLQFAFFDGFDSHSHSQLTCSSIFDFVSQPNSQGAIVPVIERRATSSTTGSCNLERGQTLYVGCGYSYVSEADRARQCKSNDGTSKTICDSWDGGGTSKNCPDFSDMKGSTDNTCVCETGIKTNKITYQDGEYGEVYACALEDYSVTECYDSLDCDFDNSMCTCVRADIYPIFVCNQMQCIPRDGSAKGQACYTSQNCASNSCVYWTGDSNDATCN